MSPTRLLKRVHFSFVSLRQIMPRRSAPLPRSHCVLWCLRPCQPARLKCALRACSRATWRRRAWPELFRLLRRWKLAAPQVRTTMAAPWLWFTGPHTCCIFRAAEQRGDGWPGGAVQVVCGGESRRGVARSGRDAAPCGRAHCAARGSGRTECRGLQYRCASPPLCMPPDLL